MQEALERFKALIAPHRSRWQTIELRILSLRGVQRLENLQSHVIFRFGTGQAPPPRTTVNLSERLIGIKDWLPMTEIDALLTQLDVGSVRLGDLEVGYTSTGGSGYHFSVYKLRRGEAYAEESVDPPAFKVEGRGREFRELVGDLWSQEVAWELMSSPIPYESVDDFRADFLGFRPIPRWWHGFGDSAYATISAPLGACLTEECRVTRGEVLARVKALGGIPLTPVAIGLLAKGREGAILRETKVLPNEEWRGCDDGLVANVAWTVPGIERATLLLRVAGEVVDVLSVRDQESSFPSPRTSAHAHFDPDLTILSRLLRGEGKDAGRDFEAGVSILLHLCGLSTVPYGLIPTLSNGPDAVGFHPERPIVLVIECTLHDIDVDAKLSRLQRRAKDISQALAGYSIWPLIFTPMDRSQIARTDYEKAMREGIAVVAADDIANLLSLAIEGAPVNNVMLYLHGLRNEIRIEGSPGWLRPS